MKSSGREFLGKTASILAASAAALLLPGLPASLRADEPVQVCSMQFENDFFGGGTDRHFTHGTRLSCLTRPIPWITDAADKLPWFSYEDAGGEDGEGLAARASVSVGQNIYTSENIGTSQLIAGDRPYAGWTYLGFGLVANQGGSRYDNLELDIGIVGPQSFAEDVQKGWHSLFDLPEPRGWDNQLKNELGINLYYEQAHRLGRKPLFRGIDYDFIPHFGCSLGNVFTSFSLGGTLRLGTGLEDDFGPPRIRPSLPGSIYFRVKDTLDWYVFTGLEGRTVLHNIFLDGNTFTDSHKVVKEFLVGDFQIGIALQFHRYRLSYIQVFRTDEYEGQSGADRFGSLNFSFHF